MDTFLIDYLKSGSAWVLVGSGPSIEMGYPSWAKLAVIAIQTVKSDAPGTGLGTIEAANKRKDFPSVFEEAKNILGAPRLIQALRKNLVSGRSSAIYKHITRWPVPVFLTTNYDDEIQYHLAALGEAYISYSNSEDHLAHLVPGLSGAILKLHGDFRSENGLILTKNHYREIIESDNWKYWRTKMTSVFQMNRIVVIGGFGPGSVEIRIFGIHA
jgi:SIR2-like domain